MKDHSSSWKLIYDKFKAKEEALREALSTLGNGYLGSRGAASESGASSIHYPGTYMAGVYNKLATRVAGKVIWNEDLVNCPNWLCLTFRIEDEDWMSPSTTKILSYKQELDMRRGVLTRKMRLKSTQGRITRVETGRIVHIEDPHVAAIRYAITPENYEGWIEIRSALDGTVQNTGVARYRPLNSQHLKAGSLGRFDENGIFLTVKTTQSRIAISEASRVRIFSGARELSPSRRIWKEKGMKISQDLRIFAYKKRRYEIEKNVSIYTSKDKGIRNHLGNAIRSAKTSPRFSTLFKSHSRMWERLWQRFDIQIEGNDFCQKALRLHIFHLLQSASVHNTKIDAGLPARGLHGEAYRGHIFWDGLFVMPFFDLHTPKISKALLMYRHRRLGQAKKYAKENGYQGAMFPWQSGSTGMEETQVLHLNPMSGKWGPDHSRIQRHVSFAIAYNVWQNWERDGDRNFLKRHGAELLVSIAQFGASLAKDDGHDGRYHTEGVMGPDEFHEKLPGSKKAGLRDNAYTNLLIVWTILKAREMLSILSKADRARLLRKLKLTQKELDRWEDITRKMNIRISGDGIIEQFEGYFGLKELNWKAYRKKYGKIKRLDRILKAEGKSPDDYKVGKQADVLMIFYFFSLAEVKAVFRRLGYQIDRPMMEKNYEYYLKRTSHGSTLSKVVHCHVSYLLKREKEAWQWFINILSSDIYDTQGGTTPEGIHIGVMGGSINIVRRVFAGINIINNQIKINPNMPKALRGIRLRFRYKGGWITLSVTKHQIKIFTRSQKTKPFAVPIQVYGKDYRLHLGKHARLRYRIVADTSF